MSATQMARCEDNAVPSSTSSFDEESDMGASTNAMRREQIAEEKERLFHNESRSVCRTKVIVLLVLALTAIAVSSVVFCIANRAEMNKFEVSYEGAAEKLLATFTEIATSRLGAISSLTVAATAHSIDHEKDWPFVTLSWFQHRALTVRLLSGATFISINPIVNDADRRAWEDYSWNSSDSGWHQEGLLYQKELDYGKWGLSYDLDAVAQRETRDPDLNISTGLANHIFSVDNEGSSYIDKGPGPYLPTWETSPVFVRTLINRNILQRDGTGYFANRSVSTGNVVLGSFEYAPPDLGKGDEPPDTKLYTTLLSIAWNRPFRYRGAPLTRIYLPIFDSFDKEQRKPVAVVVALMHWRSLFFNVLPQHMKGIHLVLRNTCGDETSGSEEREVYTIGITGDEPSAVGYGDLHQPSFDRFGRTAELSDIKQVDDGSPEGIMLDHYSCAYSVTAYPTEEMKTYYISSTPVVVTLSVVIVFAFTLIMFVVYDRLVERRQNLVLRRAEQTTGIVTSLFPKNVAERLIQEEEDEGRSQQQHHHHHQQQHSRFRSSKNKRLHDFLDGKKLPKSCLADLFPHCTVLFADISGFTAWASTKDPPQVFCFLESVYNAFDEIAVRRRVFKVETVGDCYVAATGVPDAQPQHAIIMARFAYECLVGMTEVTQRLEATLGPETANLDIRVGIHSGPVTAGVLRGDKSRFQLFGDTVNTASRMESTGIRGKIQVSQDTAHLLTMAGKAHWLEARDDSVHAKGKGVLQTYWLIRRSIRSTSKRPSASSNNSSVISTSKDLLSSVLPIASSSPTEQGISEEETRVCSAV